MRVEYLDIRRISDSTEQVSSESRSGGQSNPEIRRKTDGTRLYYFNSCRFHIDPPVGGRPQRSSQDVISKSILPRLSMAHAQPSWKYLTLTSPEDAFGVYVITMNRPPENRLNVEMGQEMILALRYIEKYLVSPGQAGAVIITSFSEKFWCTGVDFEEGSRDPSPGAEGFYPLLATLLDFALPTVALITGHTFGGACPLSLACDYRIMNSKRGFYCMPPVDLGLHFDGIGLLPSLKLCPQVARKMLLYAHRWTAEEAVADGIIDEAVPPDKMRARAIEVAKEHAPRAKAGVFALLRNELYGQASRQLQTLSHRHHRLAGGQPRTKI